MGVIFNDAMPWMAAHMVVAAYLVGGFMVGSVYAVGMLRGRTDRYHRLGLIIPFTVAAIATPVQMGVGDGLARWVYNNQPTKFAAIEMVTTTSSDVPEVLLGHLNSEGEVVGGIPIPGLASFLSRPEHREVHRRPGPGRGALKTSARANHEVNVVHLAWDVMVGVGTLLFLRTLWWWAAWIFRGEMPRAGGSCGPQACDRGARRGRLEAGWTVSEVGRQPWIVYEKMKARTPPRPHRHRDHLHRRGDPLHGARRDHDPGARQMSRRFRAGGPANEADVPYGPSDPSARLVRRRGRAGGAALMATTAALILFAAITTYAIFGGADFGAASGTPRGWDQARRTTSRGHRPRHRSRPGGQPRVADLHRCCCGPVSRRRTPRSR